MGPPPPPPLVADVVADGGVEAVGEGMSDADDKVAMAAAEVSCCQSDEMYHESIRDRAEYTRWKLSTDSWWTSELIALKSARLGRLRMSNVVPHNR